MLTASSIASGFTWPWILGDNCINLAIEAAINDKADTHSHIPSTWDLTEE